MNLKETLAHTFASKAINYISGDPEKNMLKLLSLMESVNWDNNQTKVFRDILENPADPWYRYIMDMWKDIDVEQIKVFFNTLALNASFFGMREQMKNEERYGCNIPWAVLLDPTSACNLHCTGCWAAEYGNKLNLSYEQLDSIITQAKALGTHFFLYSGGEARLQTEL